MGISPNLKIKTAETKRVCRSEVPGEVCMEKLPESALLSWNGLLGLKLYSAATLPLP